MSMNMTSKMILGFVTLIMAVVLIAPLATQGNLVTDKKMIDNEAISIATARLAGQGGSINTTVTYTIANPPTSWKIEDCPISAVVWGNSSKAYTLTTDYTFSATTGVLTLVNSSNVVYGTNSTYIDYTYCGDDYLNVSWGRTGVDTAMGFFGLAILLVSVGLFYSAYSEVKS